MIRSFEFSVLVGSRAAPQPRTQRQPGPTVLAAAPPALGVPGFDMSAPRPGAIESDLPAEVVDVTVSKDATNEDVTFPSAACVP
jgi:hypothetical protein